MPPVAGTCPGCGKAISFRQLVLGAGMFAIKCRQCGTRLHKRTRTFGLVVFGLLALWRLEDIYSMWSWQYAALVVGILALTALLTWFTFRIRIASPDLPDLPTIKLPPNEIRDGPPPHDSHFRSGSGRPPTKPNE